MTPPFCELPLVIRVHVSMHYFSGNYFFFSEKEDYPMHSCRRSVAIYFNDS